MSTIDAIILASGKGNRLSNKGTKAFLLLGKEYIVNYSLRTIINHPKIRKVYVTYQKKDSSYVNELKEQFSEASFIIGGLTRQDSVRLALESISETNIPDFVIIHDSARPFLSFSILDRIIDKLNPKMAVFPGIVIRDAIKENTPSGWKTKLNHNQYLLTQTPQAFFFQDIKQAHIKYMNNKMFPDDIALVENTTNILAIEGDIENFKITYPDDLERARKKIRISYTTKTALGIDVHAFEKGDHVILCGIKIPHTHRLVGHSDSDVALHALSDALLSLISEGDIGLHFPSNDPQYHKISSTFFVKNAYQKFISRGGILQHVDLTIVGEQPTILPYRNEMSNNLKKILNIDVNHINIKATTTDKLGFLGRKEGLAALCCVTALFP